ncbi:hypothetical protein SAMN05192583_3376 [Sphingomonas gellani]|uniref:Uncharacterized protein n=1 Tax=Sphingomonas gellani TaxID=1166340 RepID=A0A1H8ITJ1_9SPHN|nr:hypothetical protein [Sphingomonas gellani]SEN71752.1 hypothetical protein SAMN05192583_3376 [Sphingomonas gellani]
MIARLLAAMVAAQATAGPPEVRVESVDDRCRIVVGGQTADLADAAASQAVLAALPDGPVTIVGRISDPHPYRCLGGVIYMLQVQGRQTIRSRFEASAK